MPTTARPIPARVVVQLDPAHFGPFVPAGTGITADGAAIVFRTAFDAAVPAINLTDVEWDPSPDGTAGHLRLVLKPLRPWAEVSLRLPPRVDTAQVGSAVRLFVDGATYRALTRSPVLATWSSAGGRIDVGDAVQPTGFDVADAMLPIDPREPEANRLMSEWAVCPEKFLFVDVAAPERFGSGSEELGLDLHLTVDPGFAERSPSIRLGCVPAVNRRVVELPPVPLRSAGDPVRLDNDPLSEVGRGRVVVDVLRARAVRAGRTVTTYAERLAPLPPTLAVQAARVGAYALQRRDGQTWLSLVDRGPPVGGRTLLVTAACCRRALPAEPVPFARGVETVAPLRPPLWPSGEVDAVDLCQRLHRIVATLGGPPIGPVTCRPFTATVELPNGIAHGVELRMAIDPGPLSADEVFLLARVLDYAAAAGSPVDAFTRVLAETTSGSPIAEFPPRAGKLAVSGTYAATESPVASSDSLPVRAARVPPSRSRSAEQRATLIAGFAAVTRPTSVVSLAAVLRHLLGVPVMVVPFQRARQAVSPAEQLQLGGQGRSLGQHRSVWGVEVVIGPLDWRTFARFAPGTRASRRVRQLLDATVGAAAVVRPVLRADQVPPWHVGTGRLGRSLWLGKRPADRDFAELSQSAS